MTEIPVRADQRCQDEHRHDCRWPLTPLCGEAEFSEEVAQMVAEEAPRLFAVVQEYGERADGRIAAWGMVFQGHTEVVKVDGATTSLLSPELAARCFSHHPHITARVVWVDPDSLTTPRTGLS